MDKDAAANNPMTKRKGVEEAICDAYTGQTLRHRMKCDPVRN